MNLGAMSLGGLRSPKAFPFPAYAGEGWCLVLLVSASAFVSVSVNAAGSVSGGRQKALQCQACHGLDGLSKLPDAPNIAGSPEVYLAKALNDFRKGLRKNEVMSVVAQQLSEQDVADLAAYYAAIEVTAKPPAR